eukprot:TRINITY_DN3798_c0_g1_i1.p1 TRINITY_DN3798_c0_g1~~TRINITY_DN3798_c0_g1_i1.p1  ORF type:complete len:345 (-),score=54.28 TRINITY_DN3798_c0_g1_i1:1-1035(-)
MPGIIFDGASLLYGDTSGVAVWWERLLGAVAILLSALVVVYHIAVGRLARVYILDALVETTKASHSVVKGDNVSEHGNDEEEQSQPPTEEIPCPLVPISNTDLHPHTKASVVFVGGDKDHVSGHLDDVSDDGVHAAELDGSNVLEGTPVTSVEEDKEASQCRASNANPLTVSEIGDDDTHSETNSTATPPNAPVLSIAVWLTQFTVEERSIIPKAVRVPLLPRRRWAPQVGRTMYCVLTAFRPAAASYVAAHSVLRVFLVGMVAAINPQTTHGCTVVESLLAGLCFIHGIAVLTLRIFRVSALTVLQGLQSFVLGLVAIIPYLGGDMADIGTGLTITLLSLIHI